MSKRVRALVTSIVVVTVAVTAIITCNIAYGVTLMDEIVMTSDAKSAYRMCAGTNRVFCAINADNGNDLVCYSTNPISDNPLWSSDLGTRVIHEWDEEIVDENVYINDVVYSSNGYLYATVGGNVPYNDLEFVNGRVVMIDPNNGVVLHSVETLGKPLSTLVADINGYYVLGVISSEYFLIYSANDLQLLYTDQLYSMNDGIASTRDEYSEVRSSCIEFDCDSDTFYLMNGHVKELKAYSCGWSGLLSITCISCGTNSVPRRIVALDSTILVCISGGAAVDEYSKQTLSYLGSYTSAGNIVDSEIVNNLLILVSSWKYSAGGTGLAGWGAITTIDLASKQVGIYDINDSRIESIAYVDQNFVYLLSSGVMNQPGEAVWNDSEIIRFNLNTGLVDERTLVADRLKDGLYIDNIQRFVTVSDEVPCLQFYSLN